MRELKAPSFVIKKKWKQNLKKKKKNENDKYENKSKDYLGVEKRG